MTVLSSGLLHTAALNADAAFFYTARQKIRTSATEIQPMGVLQNILKRTKTRIHGLGFNCHFPLQKSNREENASGNCFGIPPCNVGGEAATLRHVQSATLGLHSEHSPW